MWPRTDFLDQLGITHPIIQAPMSGFTPPRRWSPPSATQEAWALSAAWDGHQIWCGTRLRRYAKRRTVRSI